MAPFPPQSPTKSTITASGNVSINDVTKKRNTPRRTSRGISGLGAKLTSATKQATLDSLFLFLLPTTTHPATAMHFQVVVVLPSIRNRGRLAEWRVVKRTARHHNHSHCPSCICHWSWTTPMRTRRTRRGANQQSRDEPGRGENEKAMHSEAELWQ